MCKENMALEQAFSIVPFIMNILKNKTCVHVCVRACVRAISYDL